MGKQFLEVMEDWKGFARVRGETRPPDWDLRLKEANDLLTNRNGEKFHAWQFAIKEAFSTHDFPLLFGDILDRQVLAKYAVAAPSWRRYVKTGALNDFRVANRYKVFGSETPLDEVKQGGAYPPGTRGEGKYTVQLKKFGRSFDIMWEIFVNDDLDALKDTPARFARAALRSEWKEVTKLFAKSTGPNTTLFGAPITDVDGSSVTNLGTLKLNIANVETTLSLMAQQTDEDGDPVVIEGALLVVPDALEFQARSVITSALKQFIETVGMPTSSGPTPVPFPTENILKQLAQERRLEVITNSYLPIVDTSANKLTTWYLFADPGRGGAAMEFNFLRGRETPEIAVRASNKLTTGGGPISPFEGDFEHDVMSYRVRHIMGGTALNPRYAYAQDGTT